GTTLADTAIADGEHVRLTAQGYYYGGPLGVMSEYVRSRQKVASGGSHERVAIDTWQVLAQWVITGDDATYKGVAPRHPFDPAKGDWGAFDIAVRASSLRLPGADVYPLGLADPTKSANQILSLGGGLDWTLNKNIRVVVDYDHDSYNRGAKTGNKPDENSVVARFQSAF
ncbi:MAG TPA: porin, partial [Kofleriaceae bacterium]|nr:porin [Kofleriaceae bacterium]